MNQQPVINRRRLAVNYRRSAVICRATDADVEPLCLRSLSNLQGGTGVCTPVVEGDWEVAGFETGRNVPVPKVLPSVGGEPPAHTQTHDICHNVALSSTHKDNHLPLRNTPAAPEDATETPSSTRLSRVYLNDDVFWDTPTVYPAPTSDDSKLVHDLGSRRP